MPLAKAEHRSPFGLRHFSASIPLRAVLLLCSDIGTPDLAGIACLICSLGIGATGSPVPCESLIQVHAVCGAGGRQSRSLGLRSD